MFKKVVLPAMILAATGSVYSAQVSATELYAGANYVMLDYSDEDLDLSFGMLGLRFGGQFNDYVSAEVRAGLGIQDDSTTYFGVDIDMELESMYGAYVRGGYPVNEVFYPYVIAGYTKASMKASVSGFGSESASESDLSYGFGADFNVAENLALDVEYIQYFDKDGGEITGITGGVTFKF